MAKVADDYEAVRIVVETLEPFEAKDQERILRWAREKLGLAAAPVSSGRTEAKSAGGDNFATSPPSKPTDIKSFIDNKNPQTDNQFAAAVAYYYRFEAPEPKRKDAITKDDLRDACRQTNRERLQNPAQTLVNAHYQGYLDRGERGAYAINAVGENLVAMALPEGPKPGAPAAKRRKSRSTKTSRNSRGFKSNGTKRRQ
jgi:hypothetical protein